MLRTARIIIAAAFGVVLVAGGGMSAGAITLPSSTLSSAPPSAPPGWPPAPTATATATAIPTATAAPTDTHKPPTKDEIAALFKLWNDALAHGDANKVADRYAPNAVLLPTLSNKVRKTREGIIDYFKHFLESKPSGKIKESTITILSPTVAIDSGIYVFTLTKDGKEQQVEARYTFVYELRDGTWVIVNHHSSVMPEPTK